MQERTQGGQPNVGEGPGAGERREHRLPDELVQEPAGGESRGVHPDRSRDTEREE